jgi:hypothetical protein
MDGEKKGVCNFRRLEWNAGACISLGVTRQLLEFVVVPGVAEGDLVSRAG